jgi:hypothetical protein
MDLPRKKELDDLIAAFDRYVHKDHPNPEGVGCPARTALIKLAANENASKSASVLDHIRRCAVCLEELRDLRLAGKKSHD